MNISWAGRDDSKKGRSETQKGPVRSAFWIHYSRLPRCRFVILLSVVWICFFNSIQISEYKRRERRSNERNIGHDMNVWQHDNNVRI